MGQLLVGGRGGARLKYNLFVQPDEPETKDGLWIQTPTETGFNDVVIKDSFIRSGFFAADADCEFAPQLDLTSPSSLSTYKYLAWAGYCNSAIYYVYANNLSQNCTVSVYKQIIGHSNNHLIGPLWTKDVVASSSQVLSDHFMVINNKIITRYVGNSTDIWRYGYDIETETDLGGTAYEYTIGLVPFAVADNKYYYNQPNDYKIHVFNALTQTEETFSNTGVHLGNLYCNSRLNNILYIVESGYGVYATNLDTMTSSNLISSYPWSYESSRVYFTVLKGHDLFINGGGTNHNVIYSYNLDTNTYTTWDSAPTTNYYEWLVEALGHGLLLLGKTTSATYDIMSEIKQFAQTSEAQQSGSLCILTGSTHPFKIVNIKALLTHLHKYTNAPVQSNMYHAEDDFSLHDAWYYDTDFREYPTYIGNGTQWSKFKN